MSAAKKRILLFWIRVYINIVSYYLDWGRLRFEKSEEDSSSESREERMHFCKTEKDNIYLVWENAIFLSSHLHLQMKGRSLQQ